MMGLGFGFGGIGMVIFWIVILAAIVYFVKYLVTQNKPRRESATPLEILKRRYASGEISEEEFKRLKNNLRTI